MRLPSWFWVVLLADALLALAVFKIAPQNASLLIYKTLIIGLAVAMATVVDKLFYAKPERKEAPNANIARALVFLGVVLGFASGL